MLTRPCSVQGTFWTRRIITREYLDGDHRICAEAESNDERLEDESGTLQNGNEKLLREYGEQKSVTKVSVESS